MSKKRAERRREARGQNRPPSGAAQPPVEGPLREEDLGGYRFFKKIRALLEPLHPQNEQRNRHLFYDDYAALMLFYFFNPIITSLRGMQAVSDMKQVRKKLGIRRVSLGSLSESVRLFDPDILREVFQKLAGRAAERPQHEKLKDLQEVLTVADGSILPALPRMAWAVWLPENNNGIKMHVQLEVLKETAVQMDMTPANVHDNTHFQSTLEPGRLYVVDRGFHDYGLMQKIVDAGSSFVMRLHRNAGYETVEEKELTEEAKEAGVLWDRIVRMGLQKPVRERMSEPVRLVKIHVPAREPRGLACPAKKVYSKTKRRVEPGRAYDLLIATNRLDLEAVIIGLIYQRRWLVELFFRMIKCLLGCRHLVSDSPQGVTIQIYCALIAALLLAEHTGRRPGKRAFEIMTMYLGGWCTAGEAVELFEKYAPKVKTKKQG
jgi:hypothetical protein